jgi:hypothetical protein
MQQQPVVPQNTNPYGMNQLFGNQPVQQPYQQTFGGQQPMMPQQQPMMGGATGPMAPQQPAPAQPQADSRGVPMWMKKRNS